PAAIAAIVLKLLAKMPEDRYQSAAGLLWDLERCRASLTSSGRVEPFPPGTRDAPETLPRPRRLHGRARERAALREELARSIAARQPRVVLVEGASGAGKSHLVEELRAVVAEAGGRFAAGTFGPEREGVPYHAPLQALRGLIEGVLASGEDRRAWAARIEQALGLQASLLTDVLPPLRELVSPPLQSPALPAPEAAPRFEIALRNLVASFAREPLVLLLDDLQWADAASARLLPRLAHADTGALLLVCVSRAGGLGPDHPLRAVLRDMLAKRIPVTELPLGPLEEGDVADLVAEVLGGPPEHPEAFARFVHERTGGNPYFVVEYLARAYESGLLWYDPGGDAWRWDPPRLGALPCTETVAELLIDKLRRLPEQVQAVLAVTSCLGPDVDLETLAGFLDRPWEDLEPELRAPSREGVLLRHGTRVRFVHDSVRAAASALLPPADRERLHLRIGRHLLRAPADEQVYEAADHLLRARALLTDPVERTRVAELMVRAGRRASASGAWPEAARYLAAGMELLDASGRASRYDLAFPLATEHAAARWLAGGRDDAIRALHEVLAWARDDDDRATVHRLLVEVHTSAAGNDAALEHAVEALRLLGVPVPRRPEPAVARAAFTEVLARVKAHGVAALADLPGAADARVVAVQATLAAALSPTLQADEDLFLLCCSELVRQSLLHGNSPPSAMGYAVFGMVLGPEFGAYAEGYRVGEAAVRLADQPAYAGVRARILVIHWGCIAHWTRPIAATLPPLREAFRVARETGDVGFACYGACNTIAALLDAGVPVDAALAEAEARAAFTHEAGFVAVDESLVGMVRLLRSLRGLSAPFPSFDDGTFDSAAFERHLDEAPNAFVASWYWSYRAMAAWLGGDAEGALLAGE
ncbi:MAG: ATP-binding protein, partial [Myxococcota bacterium]